MLKNKRKTWTVFVVAFTSFLLVFSLFFITGTNKNDFIKTTSMNNVVTKPSTDNETYMDEIDSKTQSIQFDQEVKSKYSVNLNIDLHYDWFGLYQTSNLEYEISNVYLLLSDTSGNVHTYIKNINKKISIQNKRSFKLSTNNITITTDKLNGISAISHIINLKTKSLKQSTLPSKTTFDGVDINDFSVLKLDNNKKTNLLKNEHVNASNYTSKQSNVSSKSYNQSFNNSNVKSLAIKCDLYKIFNLQESILKFDNKIVDTGTLLTIDPIIVFDSISKNINKSNFRDFIFSNGTPLDLSKFQVNFTSSDDNGVNVQLFEKNIDDDVFVSTSSKRKTLTIPFVVAKFDDLIEKNIQYMSSTNGYSSTYYNSSEMPLFAMKIRDGINHDSKLLWWYLKNKNPVIRIKYNFISDNDASKTTSSSELYLSSIWEDSSIEAQLDSSLFNEKLLQKTEYIDWTFNVISIEYKSQLTSDNFYKISSEINHKFDNKFKIQTTPFASDNVVTLKLMDSNVVMDDKFRIINKDGNTNNENSTDFGWKVAYIIFNDDLQNINHYKTNQLINLVLEDGKWYEKLINDEKRTLGFEPSEKQINFVFDQDIHFVVNPFPDELKIGEKFNSNYRVSNGIVKVVDTEKLGNIVLEDFKSLGTSNIIDQEGNNILDPIFGYDENWVVDDHSILSTGSHNLEVEFKNPIDIEIPRFSIRKSIDVFHEMYTTEDMLTHLDLTKHKVIEIWNPISLNIEDEFIKKITLKFHNNASEWYSHEFTKTEKIVNDSSESRNQVDDSFVVDRPGLWQIEVEDWLGLKDILYIKFQDEKIDALSFIQGFDVNDIELLNPKENNGYDVIETDRDELTLMINDITISEFEIHEYKYIDKKWDWVPLIQRSDLLKRDLIDVYYDSEELFKNQSNERNWFSNFGDSYLRSSHDFEKTDGYFSSEYTKIFKLNPNSLYKVKYFSEIHKTEYERDIVIENSNYPGGFEHYVQNNFEKIEYTNNNEIAVATSDKSEFLLEQEYISFLITYVNHHKRMNELRELKTFIENNFQNDESVATLVESINFSELLTDMKFKEVREHVINTLDNELIDTANSPNDILEVIAQKISKLESDLSTYFEQFDNSYNLYLNKIGTYYNKSEPTHMFKQDSNSLLPIWNLSNLNIWYSSIGHLPNFKTETASLDKDNNGFHITYTDNGIEKSFDFISINVLTDNQESTFKHNIHQVSKFRDFIDFDDNQDNSLYSLFNKDTKFVLKNGELIPVEVFGHNIYSGLYKYNDYQNTFLSFDLFNKIKLIYNNEVSSIVKLSSLEKQVRELEYKEQVINSIDYTSVFKSVENIDYEKEFAIAKTNERVVDESDFINTLTANALDLNKKNSATTFWISIVSGILLFSFIMLLVGKKIKNKKIR